jgi:hypothetical protein
MQQLQAKWLSTFCEFSGLTIHSGKIKATIVGKIDSKHELKTNNDAFERKNKSCSHAVTSPYPSRFTAAQHKVYSI